MKWRLYMESQGEDGIRDAVDSKICAGAADELAKAISLLPRGKIEELNTDAMEIVADNPDAIPEEARDEILDGLSVDETSEYNRLVDYRTAMTGIMCIVGALILGYEGVSLAKCKDIRRQVYQIQTCKDERQAQDLRKELADYIKDNKFFVGSHYRCDRDGKDIEHTVNADSMRGDSNKAKVPSWHSVDKCQHGWLDSMFE